MSGRVFAKAVSSTICLGRRLTLIRPGMTMRAASPMISLTCGAQSESSCWFTRGLTETLESASKYSTLIFWSSARNSAKPGTREPRPQR